MATQPLWAFFPIVSSTLVLVYRSHCCSMKTTSPLSWICIPKCVHQSRIISRAGPMPRESFLAALSLLIDAEPTQLPHCSTIIRRPYKITFGREVYFALDLDFEFENPHNFLDLPLQLTSSPILANYTKWLKAQRMWPEERSDGYMDAGGDVMMEILNSEESDACMDVDGDVVMEILEPEDESDSSMDVDVDVTTEDMFVE
ncbi:hypothetical protein BD769DRAFT_1391311 [Suillus cothurnatus]|nr:hypothetical protein BD769DRAFT_1391311 [Suillus cothurnatus]